MASFYWIKLYHEIIDDPKMATLSDNIWRRIIELFLLAGRHNKDGQLPNTKSIAWELRSNPDDLLIDLNEIEAIGIIIQNADGWFVVNFKERQAARSQTERQQDHRNATKRKQYYNEDVTAQSRSVTQITDTEQITDNRTEQITEAERAFLNTQKIVERLVGYLATPKDNQAIKEMVDGNITEEDIKAAISFLDGKKRIYGATDLLPSAKVSHAKRVQGNNGHKSYKDSITQDGSIIRVHSDGREETL